MSETSALMDTLRQEGVSPDLLRAVEEYRTAHPLAEALRPRIPSPAFVYYGREVWEQALAALLCGENLLLAGGKATGKNVLAENLSAAFGRPAETGFSRKTAAHRSFESFCPRSWLTRS